MVVRNSDVKNDSIKSRRTKNERRRKSQINNKDSGYPQFYRAAVFLANQSYLSE